eukprot:TCONS_00013897-protein
MIVQGKIYVALLVLCCFCGAVSSNACSPGFQKDALTEKCRECVEGTFSIDGGACQKCLPGTFANKTGSIKCKPCANGTISRTEASTSCQKCQQIDWLPNKDQTECIQNEFVYKLNDALVYDFSKLAEKQDQRHTINGKTYPNEDPSKDDINMFINISISFCTPQFHHQCKDLMNGQFQIEVTKNISALWADIHARASMGKKFTARRGVDPPAKGFILESTDGTCIDRFGRPLNRTQRTTINMECNIQARSKPGEDKTLIFVNNSTDECLLDLTLLTRYACPRCTCDNYLDSTEDNRCWTEQIGFCNFDYVVNKKMERKCSHVNQCDKSNIVDFDFPRKEKHGTPAWVYVIGAIVALVFICGGIFMLIRYLKQQHSPQNATAWTSLQNEL